MSDSDVEQITAAFKLHKPERIPGKAKLHSIVSDAKARVERYIQMGAFRSNDCILDVGCAWSALLFGMPNAVGYTGIDASKPSIAIAKDLFSQRGQFEWIDVKAAKYNPTGKKRLRSIRFPFDDESFDAALACSLFTHFTRPSDVAHYLSEIRRCLKPGGRLLATWFRSPPHEFGGTERRFAFPEESIRDVLGGWNWIHDEGGTTTDHDDQWHTVTQI